MISGDDSVVESAPVKTEDQIMDKFGSFLLGLGLGVGVGLVFAPQSGEETRDLLKSKADESKDYLKRQSEGLRGSAADAVDKGREALNRQRDSLADAIEAGRQAYREKVEQAEGKPV
jgi:gas vesicle protein